MAVVQVLFRVRGKREENLPPGMLVAWWWLQGELNWWPPTGYSVSRRGN